MKRWENPRAALAAGLACLAIPGALAAQDDSQSPDTRALVAQVRQAEVVPPPNLGQPTARATVMLRPEATSVTLEQLRVQRRFEVAELRAQPIVQLKQGRADMTPLLVNPAGISNVAEQLRAKPRLATVNASTLDVVEIEQGLVVRQFLSYRVRSGVCTDPQRRTQLEQEGIQCFERVGVQARISALADPTSVRFIADSQQRSAAANEIERATAADRADIAEQIAKFRDMLRDPAMRADIEAEIGAPEAARLEALDDEALEAELVNAAEVELEEVLFIPGETTPGQAVLKQPNFVQTAPSETKLANPTVRGAAAQPQVTLESAAGQSPVRREVDTVQARQQMKETTVQPRASTASRTDSGTELAQRTIDERQDIAQVIYVTGFTFGREHEWRWRVSLTVKWCVVGCKRTYFLEPFAGYSFGFGLRFPVRMAGAYRYQARGGRERATFIPEFVPINGTEADYLSAGIASHQLFEAQELVAEAGAWAGFRWKLPLDRRGDVCFGQFFDATQRLPEPYRNGQLKPPAPGTRVEPVEVTFSDIDLIGGRANLSVVGAKVHPAIRFDLTSDKLLFELDDRVSGQTIRIDRSGHFYDVAIADGHRSRFVVRDPVYNLTFSMTPGIVPTVFVDISVWSKEWSWPVWFPRLEVEIPRGGIDFSCHRGTTCAHSYDFRPRSFGPQPRPTVRTRGPSG